MLVRSQPTAPFVTNRMNINDSRHSPKRWSFEPAETYRPFRFKKKSREEVWVAPEHARMASGMKRDYPRDDWGNPIRRTTKELVLDKRPNCMIPPRKTYQDSSGIGE